MATREAVFVGVGVIIVKDGKILMGLRKGKHGTGTWSIPGGKLDYMEELEDCARREVYEETSLRIKNLRQLTTTNNMFKDEDKHSVSIIFLADYDGGEVRVMEPEKCAEWRWCDWDDLPQPLFVPIVQLKKRGFKPL